MSRLSPAEFMGQRPRVGNQQGRCGKGCPISAALSTLRCRAPKGYVVFKQCYTFRVFNVREYFPTICAIGKRRHSVLGFQMALVDIETKKLEYATPD